MKNFQYHLFLWVYRHIKVVAPALSKGSTMNIGFFIVAVTKITILLGILF